MRARRHASAMSQTRASKGRAVEADRVAGSRGTARSARSNSRRAGRSRASRTGARARARCRGRAGCRDSRRRSRCDAPGASAISVARSGRACRHSRSARDRRRAGRADGHEACCMPAAHSKMDWSGPRRPLERRPMRIFLRRLGAFLLFLLVALCFAPTLVPPFLDRIYYQGPVSDHFDGRHFFNPDDAGAAAGSTRAASSTAGPMASAPPGRTASRSTRPCRRRGSTGSDMLVTWIGHSTVLVQTAGPQHPHRSDLVGARLAFLLRRPAAGSRAPGVRFEDLPRIDLVLISHNHYDHLDLPTLQRLWDRDRPLIVTSLGNDTILRGEGIEAVARDWGRTRRRSGPASTCWSSATIIGARAGAPTATARSGRPSPCARPAATSSSPATPAGAAATGRAQAARHGPFRLAHPADRRLSAARRDAGQPCRSGRIGAHLPKRSTRSARSASTGARSSSPSKG